MMEDLWYHNAVIYSLDVETYFDADGDTIGDFKGLISKINYLSGLGINCIWLRPFYPSPMADDGYDIMDYYSIDSRFGNIGDFVEFIVRAKAAGINVIIDLVANHTSDKHYWFQQSRKDEKSIYRNYYIWSPKPDEKYKAKNLLGEKGIWNYDRKAKAYYLHHFLKEEPDLNLLNPRVKKEIKKIMGYWLQLGIAGFRIDAAHILVKEIGKQKKKKKVIDFLNEMRSFVSSRNHEAILLAEANVAEKRIPDFFGNGSRVHLMFNFLTNMNLFLAMARKDPSCLASSLKSLSKTKGRWVNFLRHHDELNLEFLDKNKRSEIFKAFAPEKHMQIFGHGIRRRLPPMLNGDRKRLELFYSVMFSLPGIPLINYGEEIGMGDDLSEKGRNSVRTVMQWNDSDNAGFSKCVGPLKVHSVVKGGEFDFRKVNVVQQQRDPDSFLSWIKRLISIRKECPQLAYGKYEILENSCSGVLSAFCIWRSETIIVLHNFDSQSCKIDVKTEEKNFINMIEIFSDSSYEEVTDLKQRIQLGPYGYRWFKCEGN
jgi:maltose alpha-D-glucosyltransferase / alpha-amylase